jgi:hypothetical protein
MIKTPLMPAKPTPEEHDAVAITRLVDDPSAAAESADLAALTDRPEIRRQVESQRRVSRELRTGGPAVPDHLVRTVQGKVRERYGAGAETSPRRRLASGLSWRPAVAVTAVAALCAAAVIGIVGIGGSSGPSIPAAAGLAFATSTGPAPAALNARLLDVSYGGVTYPNYAKFSVPPTGTRTDRIGGRPALTVFYRLPNGTRLSYTVFSGKAVPLPHDAREVAFEGVPLREFSTPSGLSVVTLVRYGRTCVLAARVKPDVVLGLAAAPVLAQAHA